MLERNRTASWDGIRLFLENVSVIIKGGKFYARNF